MRRIFQSDNLKYSLESGVENEWVIEWKLKESVKGKVFNWLRMGINLGFL
jgi:hypothetical protein